jgi:hypothetical protein
MDRQAPSGSHLVRKGNVLEATKAIERRRVIGTSVSEQDAPVAHTTADVSTIEASFRVINQEV